jgi:HNH endonuclease
MTAGTRVVTISTLPEAQLLDYFWTAQADPGADRFQLLQELSVIAIKRPPEWDPKAVREACRNDHLTADRCFTCYNADRRLYWHHLIEIHHGGSNHARNRVALCYRCHRVIHPWLTEWQGDQDKRDRWTRVGDLVEQLIGGAKKAARCIA